MRRIKRICAILLSAILCLSVSTSCKKKKKGEEATVIEIYAWQSGYGIEWLQKIVDDYNASQSTYTAKLSHSTNPSTIINTLDLGSANTYDLYFTMLKTSTYNSEFIDMTEILNSSPTGESGTIRSKYYPGLIDGLKDANGKEKFLCYGYGNASIVYNKNIISEDRVPNTTDELEMLVAELSATCKPWLFYNDSGINGYWNYLHEAWAAQYNGLDYHYNTFQKLKGSTTPSKDVLIAKDGRYKALEVMESIITPDTTHSHCTNTEYTTVQTLFLDGAAAMMPNGSWLINESKKSANVDMMKVPVISSIVEKLEDKSMSDETLSLIIDAVDAGATSSDLCSANDFKRIKEARNLMYNNATESYIFAPSYSNALEGVKDFLKFYHKDSSILRYNESTKLPAACKLNDPSLFDVSKQSVWTQTMFKIANEGTPLLSRLDRSDVFLEQGQNSILNITTAIYLLSSNPADRKNADQIWNDLVSTANEYWSDWVD